MVDEITTNPQRSEPVVDKDGMPTDQLIEYFDDIEITINNIVGRASEQFPQHRTGTLPPPSENIGGIVFGEDTDFGFLVPVFVSTPFDMTTFRIDNVTMGGGGVAQFNFTLGPSPQIEIGEEVVIFGYTDPSRQIYNVTKQVTFSTASFFQIASIPFAGSESQRDFMRGSVWRTIKDNKIVV